MPDVAFFKFEVDGLSSTLDVVKFEGEEGISELFEFEIDLSSTDAAVDFDDVVGKPAVLTIETSDGTRHVHGIISTFGETGVGPRRTTYTATLVPALWTLGLRHQSQIFQELKTGDILKKVFEAAGLQAGRDFEIKLNGSYESREYCVQYRETDLAFASRLMEEEGMFYFFRHDENGHTLVVADDVGAYGDIEGDTTVPFRAADTGMQAQGEEVHNVSFERAMRIGKVALRDWNFQKTELDLTHDKESDAEKELEFYDYPGNFDNSSLGKTRSVVKLEAFRAERDVLSGGSTCRRFAGGCRFQLSEHPRDDFNAEYVLIHVEHEGRQPQAAGEDAMFDDQDDGPMYDNTFEAIPSGVIYRPPQETPRARVEGLQTAIVTGPAGQEIHVDKHGRVKVHFHWDRKGSTDDKSSCWVRVSQVWAGGSWGGMVIPRIGHEVVVDFLEGDPDRPLIVGRVYNGSNVHGYDLPADKTKTSIRSNSSPGGNGFNELMFEDAAGSELVFLHAQKDWHIKVLNDRAQEIDHDHTHKVGHDETMEVGNDRRRKVGKNEEVTIGEDETIDVGRNHSETIGKNMSLTVKASRAANVHADDTVTVGGNRTTSIAKNLEESVGGGATVSVSGALSESVGGKYSLSVSGATSISAGASMSLDVAQNLSTKAGGNASTEVGGNSKSSVTRNVDDENGGKRSISVGDALSVKAKKAQFELADELEIKVGSAKLTMKKSGDITIEGKAINIKASGDLTLKGSSIKEN